MPLALPTFTAPDDASLDALAETNDTPSRPDRSNDEAEPPDDTNTEPKLPVPDETAPLAAPLSASRPPDTKINPPMPAASPTATDPPAAKDTSPVRPPAEVPDIKSIDPDIDASPDVRDRTATASVRMVTDPLEPSVLLPDCT